MDIFRDLFVRKKLTRLHRAEFHAKKFLKNPKMNAFFTHVIALKNEYSINQCNRTPALSNYTAAAFAPLCGPP